MLEHRPPRRDPRVLALVPTARGTAYAALDAWELRGLGEIAHGDRGTLRLALARLLIQTRASAVVVARRARGLRAFDAAATVARALARPAGVPVIVIDAAHATRLVARAPALDRLAGLYPELAALPLAGATPALRLACAALSSLTFPPRHYARPTDPHPARAGLAAGAARRARTPRVPVGSPARRRARDSRGDDHLDA